MKRRWALLLVGAMLSTAMVPGYGMTALAAEDESVIGSFWNIGHLRNCLLHFTKIW